MKTTCKISCTSIHLLRGRHPSQSSKSSLARSWERTTDRQNGKGKRQWKWEKVSTIIQILIKSYALLKGDRIRSSCWVYHIHDPRSGVWYRIFGALHRLLLGWYSRRKDLSACPQKDEAAEFYLDRSSCMPAGSWEIASHGLSSFLDPDCLYRMGCSDQFAV